jgi:hypothetical protein
VAAAVTSASRGSGDRNAPLLANGLGTMYHSQNDVILIQTVLPAWESVMVNDVDSTR